MVHKFTLSKKLTRQAIALALQEEFTQRGLQSSNHLFFKNFDE